MPDVVVPKLNNNDSAYTLVAWLVDDGQAVSAGDAVAEVETSKAAVELACESDGIFHRLAGLQTECQPGDVIARTFASEEERRAFVASGEAAGDGDGAGDAAPEDHGVVLTESARARAEQAGLSAEQLQSVGKKVVKLEDVERLVAGAGGPGTEAPSDSLPREPLTRAQKGVGAVVSESHRTVPAAFAAIKVDVGKASDLARELTRTTRRMVGVPELLVKAIAGLRERFPLFFATGYDGEAVRLAQVANVGVTIDVGTGLFIPVVRDAEARSCVEIAEAMIEYRTTAMESGFRASDLEDGNIVVSLHNEPDVVLAFPIVFPGQTCVVSLGGVQREAAVDDTGSVVTRRAAIIGATYDHRVVNGRDAVSFLQEIKNALETPAPLAED